MKWLAVVGALIGLGIVGCKKAAPKQDPAAKKTASRTTGAVKGIASATGPQRIERARRTANRIRKALAAFNQGRLDDVIQSYSDDVTWYFPGAGPKATVRGKDAIKARWVKSRKQTPDLKIVPKRILSFGGRNAVVEAVIGGTSLKTGKRFGVAVAYWVQMRKGKIKGLWSYMNPLSVRVQSGLGPTKKNKRGRKEKRLGKIPWKAIAGSPTPIPFPEGDPEVIIGPSNPDNEKRTRDLLSKRFSDPAPIPYLDEETALYIPRWNREMKGLARIRKGFKMVEGAFPDLKREAVALGSAGDWVAYRMKAVGTHAGPLPGMPPTQRRVAFAMLGMGRWKDGKLRWGASYTNPLGLLRQLKGKRKKAK